jgi:hypothetical protein
MNTVPARYVLLMLIYMYQPAALAVDTCSDYVLSENPHVVVTKTLETALNLPRFYYLIDTLVVFVMPASIIEDEHNRFRDAYAGLLPLERHTEVHTPLIEYPTEWPQGGMQTIELGIRSALLAGDVVIYDTQQRQFLPEILIVEFETRKAGRHLSGGDTHICYLKWDMWSTIMKIHGPIS